MLLSGEKATVRMMQVPRRGVGISYLTVLSSRSQTSSPLSSFEKVPAARSLPSGENVSERMPPEFLGRGSVTSFPEDKSRISTGWLVQLAIAMRLSVGEKRSRHPG